MAKQINLPKDVSPEKFEQLKKPLVKAILSESFTDGISDLTVEDGSGNTIVQGKFLERRVEDGGRVNNRIFEYSISESGGEFEVSYKPIAGEFNEPEDWKDDEDLVLDYARTRKPVTLNFAEGAELTEDWFAEYQERVTAQLAEELLELGFAEFIEEVSDSQESWARTPKADWAK